MSKAKTNNGIRHKIHEIIFEADTWQGKLFDIILLLAIFFSVIVVLLETVPGYAEKYGSTFITLEWTFTILFTIEYLLRIYAVEKPVKYMTSFFGVIDLLSILPSFISIFIPGTHSLIVIRILRLLRIFRIFKMVSFISDAQVISDALRASKRKILVFLLSVILMVIIIGSIMYLVEGGVNEGFDSIPRAVYWSIVTLTTVGYGDISPQTSLGQFLAAMVMIIGYGIIAVPTGIVTSEFAKTRNKKVTTQTCKHCMKEDHDEDALYCNNCGNKLD